MRLHYAQTYQCDLCGATETVPEPENVRVPDLPRPLGWVVNRVLLVLRDGHRSPDICAVCARRPFAEVVELTMEKLGDR